MLNLEWRFGYRDAHHFPKARIRVRTPHPRGNSVHGNAYRGVETHTHTHTLANIVTRQFMPAGGLF